MKRNPSLTTLYFMTLICLAGGFLCVFFGLLFGTADDLGYLTAGIVLLYIGFSLLGFGSLCLLFSLVAHAIVRAIEDKQLERPRQF
ncbi:MAG: hypothetical protein WDA07_13215 [Leucobacter sp.]